MEDLLREFEDSVQQSIATHKIEDALNHINRFIEEFDGLLKSFQNDTILIQSRYHEFRLNSIRRLLTQDEIIVVGARISNDLLRLLDLVLAEVHGNYDSFYRHKLENYGRQRLIYDSSNPAFFQGTVSIMKFNTAKKLFNIRFSMEQDHLTWTLTADENEFVGLNFLLDLVKGKVTFEYMIKKSDFNAKNIVFFMIPMKSNYDLIEVGSDQREAKENASSRLRLRKDAVFNESVWQSEKIVFDFSEIEGTKECVFGPRINEGCISNGPAILSIREIRIYRD